MFKGAQKSRPTGDAAPQDSQGPDKRSDSMLEAASANAVNALIAVTDGIIPPCQQTPLGTPLCKVIDGLCGLVMSR